MAEGSVIVEEREAFLSEVHAGSWRSTSPAGGRLALPIWHLLEAGEVLLGMDGRSVVDPPDH